MGSELNRLVDAVPGLIWTALADGALDFVNQRWIEYTGMSLDASAGSGWLSAIHPEDLPYLRKRWGKFLESGRPDEFEARLRRQDGVFHWFLLSASPIVDEVGRLVKWCGINTDIENRKQAELALLLRNSHHGSVADAIPALITFIEPSGTVESINRHVVEYFGATLEEVRNWQGESFVHPDDLPAVGAAWLRAVETGEPYSLEERLRRSDGVYRWFHCQALPLRDEAGKVARWYSLQTDIDDRKRVEEALVASERDLKTIINTLPTTAWATNPDGYVEFLSDRWLNYAGLTAEQATGLGWGQAIHPDDQGPLFSYWQSCLETGAPVDTEARMRRFDGEYRWFLFLANPLRDESGTIIKWYGTNIDIEDRKRADDELRRINGYLEEAQRLSLTGSFTWDVSADEHFWSGETFRIFEIEPRNTVHVADILPRIHPDDMEKAEQVIGGAFCGVDFETELRLVMPSGASKYANVVGHRIREIQDRPVFLGCIRDITERKLAESELRLINGYLADAQALGKTGSFSFDYNKDTVVCSREACRILDFAMGSKLTATMLASRVHPDDIQMFNEFLEKSIGPQYLMLRLVMPDGRVKWLNVVAHVTQRTDGIPGGTASIQDVTEQRQSDEALAKIRSELAHVTRIMSLGLLTASIAHEVNQPLSGIITNASTCLRMLAADPPNIEGARETAKRTIRDGNRAAQVITRLRALFARKIVAADAVDLNEATREIIALSASELQRNRVILRSELANGLPIIFGDRVQLQQVILNLVLNAADAMSEVSDRPRHLTIRTEMEGGDHIRFTAQDNGSGFDSQEADRLFEAFHTTKSAGMGIGLSVSQSIVDSHGGRLWATANDGPGATFSFSIPLSPGRDGDQRHGDVRTAAVADQLLRSA